ncbi:MAG TPA: Ig-like domain-containing protein, partial [Bacteroidales bacterium]|nr:Ig-like domain-containing protein [Bacteroidales bacterium]
GASNATISDATGVGTITNNDSQPTVTLSIGDISIVENAGSTLVTATLSNVSYQNVTVNLSFTGAATGGGTDYSVSDVKIDVPAGSLTGTITITAVQDVIVEGGESITIDISTVNNGSEDGVQQVTTTIDDDDAPNHLPNAKNDTDVVNEDASVATNVAANDTGLEDGGLVVTVTSGPSHGTISISGTTVTYTPVANYNGTDSYTYQICDADGDCSTANVFIDVNSVDDLPVATNDNVSVNEDENIAVDVALNDTGLGDDGLVVSIISGPGHGTVSVSGTTITYTPSPNYNGADSYTYQICDADGDCSSATVNITVNSVDDIPVANNDNISTLENTSINLHVLNNDTGLGDGGLVVTINVAPLHGTAVVEADQTITYTPSTGYLGNDIYTYQVCDADGDCVTAVVSIVIDNVDDIPVAVDDAVTGNEDAATTFDVLSNDTGLTDGGLTVTITTSAKQGTVLVNADNTITYTPFADYYGKDSLVYQVCDVDGDCSSAKVVITVNNVDDQPVAVNDNITVNEDTNVSTDVAANDAGLGDGGLVVTVTSGPLHGTVIINGTTVTYTPSADYYGTDSYTYQLCDADGDCVSGTVNITVDNVDDIPSANDDVVSVNEDASSIFNVLINDTDLVDGGIVVSIATNAKHGNAVVNADNTITYTPSPDYNGNDTIVYSVCDANGDCSTAKLIITVVAVNDIPVSIVDNAVVAEDSNVVIDVLSNDTGLGDGGIVVSVSSNPAHGTVTVNPDRTITYTPAPDYYGQDSFTYKVCDSNGDCIEGTVNVTVNNVNDVPSLNNDAYSGNEGSVATVYVLANDAGLGDGGITVSILADGKHGTAVVNPDKTITYTPAGGFFGKDTITYQVCDANNECATAWIVFTLASTNHTPVATPGASSVTTPVNTPVEVCFTVSDADADHLTATPVVAHGFVVPSTTATCFIYTPANGFTGKDTVYVTWCDPEGSCVNAYTPVNVLAPGEKPVAKVDTIFLQTTIGKEAAGCIEMVTSTANLTLSTLETPEHGSLTINNLCVNYKPDEGFYGTVHIPVLICNNSGLCDTVIVTVKIIPVKIPQGFSPNGDGLNEYFMIEGLDLYDKVSITVFNRWGNEVYRSDMYKNDWDGSSKNSFTLGNSKLPAGTYFYVVDFHDGSKPVTGYVYLSR